MDNLINRSVLLVREPYYRTGVLMVKLKLKLERHITEEIWRHLVG